MPVSKRLVTLILPVSLSNTKKSFWKFQDNQTLYFCVGTAKSGGRFT
jgi:hypothetical protein